MPRYQQRGNQLLLQEQPARRQPAALSRSQRYTVLLFVFYFMVSSLASGLQAHATDNAAHVGGLLTWAALGAVLPARAGAGVGPK